MKKKVWIFNHYAEPPQYETRVRNNVMAKYLMRAGCDVTIFSASTIHNTDINLITDGSPYIRREYDGLKFIHINVPKYSGNGVSRIINMLLFPFRLWRYTKRLGEIPDVIVDDLVVMAMDFPFKIAKRYHVPIIMEVRDLWPESIVAMGVAGAHNPAVMALRRVEKWSYKRANAVVFSMEGGYDYIKEQGWEKEIPQDKVYYINNGVDLEVYDSNQERYTIDDPDLEDPATFKVIYAGSIRLGNGLEQLVSCAVQLKDYPQIKFLVYGEGNYLETLREKCRSEGVENLVFKGSVEKKYIPYVLSKGNLNVLNYTPSSVGVFRYGSSQNKLFEYLASGRPVLSNIEMAYDVVKKYQCGVTGNLTDGKQYADAVLQMYNLSPEAYKEMCQNARLAAQQYDYKNLTRKLMEVIEGVEKP